MVELGWITDARARAVYREGETVIEAATKGAAPFDDRWIGWRPDPTWSAPMLPDDWALVPSYN